MSHLILNVSERTYMALRDTQKSKQLKKQISEINNTNYNFNKHTLNLGIVDARYFLKNYDDVKGTLKTISALYAAVSHLERPRITHENMKTRQNMMEYVFDHNRTLISLIRALKKLIKELVDDYSGNFQVAYYVEYV